VQGGEVDIVARRGRTLVEVKARATQDAAAFSLDQWLRRVAVPPIGSSHVSRRMVMTFASTQFSWCRAAGPGI